MSVLSDVVSSALLSVGNALPELKRTMTADGATASVVVSSSVDKGTDAASSSGPNEKFRIIAQSADFPSLSLESLVTLDEDAHFITSLRETGGAALFIGLSGALTDTLLGYSGTRRRANALRNISLTVPALVNESQSLASFSDSYGRNDTLTFYIVLRTMDWLDETPPDVGDKLDYNSRPLVVSNVEKRTGYYFLTARERRS